MKNILVLCKTNSATSVMVEAIINAHSRGGWRAMSAGANPSPGINAHAKAALKAAGIVLPESAVPKSWDLFHGGDAPRFEIVLTVAENVGWEEMPVFSGVPRLLHWALPDPLAIECSPSERADIFRALTGLIEARVANFLDEERLMDTPRQQANDNRQLQTRAAS